MFWEYENNNEMLDYVKSLIKQAEELNADIDNSCLESLIQYGHIDTAEHLLINHYIPNKIGSNIKNTNKIY